MHELTLKVYLEDTDAGGIVYYANYLKFMERARTEMLHSIGIDHAAMMANDDLMFVVRRCTIDYTRPAKLADELVVRSEIIETGAASLTMRQKIEKSGSVMVSADVQLACISKDGAVRRIPAAILAKIASTH